MTAESDLVSVPQTGVSVILEFRNIEKGHCVNFATGVFA